MNRPITFPEASEHTERVVITLPGPLADPVPHIETPATLAEKLREIGYKEPVLHKCAVQGCDALTFKTYCDRCQEEMEGTPLPIPWRTVLTWLGVAVVLIVAVALAVTK